jgi:hypothetical protein
MMPEESVYGDWPASGEIDLAESKGNSGDDYPTGRDSVVSALVSRCSRVPLRKILLTGSKHWGPISAVDAFYKTNGKHNVRRADYSESYYTYGLEWNERYIFTYINSRLLVRKILYQTIVI